MLASAPYKSFFSLGAENCYSDFTRGIFREWHASLLFVNKSRAYAPYAPIMFPIKMFIKFAPYLHQKMQIKHKTWTKFVPNSTIRRFSSCKNQFDFTKSNPILVKIVAKTVQSSRKALLFITTFVIHSPFLLLLF